MSCIYEADKKKENETAKQNEYESDEDEDEHINHAGRLLLNHRYIEDTIKTQNKTFLDNPEVKNIINKMWYGCEQVNAKTVRGDVFSIFRNFQIFLTECIYIE